MFLLAIIAAPIAGIVPAAATAPALILVGFFMLSHIGRIDFDDVESAIPAFLTLIAIPLTYSIAHGIGYGFIAFVAIKLMCGKWREVHILMYAVASAFAAYFLFGTA
jgi:AGZA family xanthine/uracil permease-like MFS transporter